MAKTIIMTWLTVKQVLDQICGSTRLHWVSHTASRKRRVNQNDSCTQMPICFYLFYYRVSNLLKIHENFHIIIIPKPLSNIWKDKGKRETFSHGYTQKPLSVQSPSNAWPVWKHQLAEQKWQLPTYQDDHQARHPHNMLANRRHEAH